MAPLGPYKLVTVNNAPERAQRLIGLVVETVKDKYTIIHAGNIESPEPEGVKKVVSEIQPDILFTASMWSAEESLGARKAALEAKPGIKTFALPQGLQVSRGPEAVVELIVENLPGIIEGDLGILEG